MSIDKDKYLTLANKLNPQGDHIVSSSAGTRRTVMPWKNTLEPAY